MTTEHLEFYNNCLKYCYDIFDIDMTKFLAGSETESFVRKTNNYYENFMYMQCLEACYPQALMEHEDSEEGLFGIYHIMHPPSLYANIFSEIAFSYGLTFEQVTKIHNLLKYDIISDKMKVIMLLQDNMLDIFTSLNIDDTVSDIVFTEVVLSTFANLTHDEMLTLVDSYKETLSVESKHNHLSSKYLWFNLFNPEDLVTGW